MPSSGIDKVYKHIQRRMEKIEESIAGVNEDTTLMLTDELQEWDDDLNILRGLEVKKITGAELLKSILPPQEYRNFNEAVPTSKKNGNVKKSKGTNSTRSPFRLQPSEVREWDGFKSSVKGMVFDKTNTIYDELIFLGVDDLGKIGGEEDTREAISLNLLRVFRTLGKKQYPQEEIMRPESVNMEGKPDFILAAGNTILLIIEIKFDPVLSLPPTSLLSQEYMKDREANSRGGRRTSVMESVEQVHGYLGRNGLQYAILSTYERTWFFWRPPNEPRILYISPTIERDNESPTLLECIACIIDRARQGHQSPRLNSNGMVEVEDSTAGPSHRGKKRKHSSKDSSEQPETKRVHI